MGSRPGGSPTALRELRAAGIDRPSLRAAYLRCREINAAHGRTYFLATRLLPAARRPMVHALYGFARWVDDLVDDPEASPAARREALLRVERELDESWTAGGGADPLVTAVVDAAARYELDVALFRSFLHSMRMDLTVRDYPTRASLDAYMHGSAGVIGLQVMPILGTSVPRAEAAPYAEQLGHAFQLTNFLRDIAEDLDRGRLYLPADELAAFGVDRERLLRCRRRGRADGPVRRALADQVARAHACYRAAEPGIRLLAPHARPCVATAFTLYGDILDGIVRSGYQVFAQRVTVSRARRLGVALPAAGAAGLFRLGAA
ncbi:phytoene/squalene synthase family protein [Salinifilum ghardaiensis]